MSHEEKSLAEQIAERVVSLLTEAGADAEVLGFVAVLSDGTPALCLVDEGIGRTALLGAMELAREEILAMAFEADDDDDAD